MDDVIFDALKTSNLNSGLGQYCYSLAKEIFLQKNNLDIKFLSEKKLDFVSDKLHLSPSFLPKIFGWNNVKLIHQTHQDSNVFAKDRNTKIVLTIHDLNFLDKNYSKFQKQKKINLLQRKIDRANYITFISEYTKEIVKCNLNFDESISKVIYNGNPLNLLLKPSSPSFIDSNKKFFFTIGMIQEKKNFHVLLPILKKFPEHYLIIAGNKNGSYARMIESNAKLLGVWERVIMPGAISDEQKIWCYKNCELFLFPSLSEGFGLPVIEALSMGAKVLCSNKCSLPEIGKDYVAYLENFDSEYLQIKTKEVLEGPEKYSKQESLEYIKKFSWHHAAKEYLDVYKKLLL